MRNMEDTFRHQGLRKKLVDSIRKRGIKDEAVLSAIGKVPRHIFIAETAFDELAYTDQAFPIGEGQTISQPYTVAYQNELLKVSKGQKVLEIGTGSGYQAAILAEIGARVFTIERKKKLYIRSKKLLEEMGYTSIKVFYRDGFNGLPSFAPFDRIIVTAAAPEIPQPLTEQLANNGIMVIPLGAGAIQKMVRITKDSDNHLSMEEFASFKFVPMLKGKK